MASGNKSSRQIREVKLIKVYIAIRAKRICDDIKYIHENNDINMQRKGTFKSKTKLLSQKNEYIS